MALESIIDATAAKDSFVLDAPTLDTNGLPQANEGVRFFNIHDVSGLSNEHETTEMHVGGTDATAWVVGVKKKGDITVKRFFQKSVGLTEEGSTGNGYFRAWRRVVSNGQAVNYMRNIRLIVCDKSFNPVIFFIIKKAYPQRIEWEDLGADDSSVWMESMILKISDLQDFDDPADVGAITVDKKERPSEVSPAFAVSQA